MRCIECKRAMTVSLVGITQVHHCEECGASVRLREPSIGQYNLPRPVPVVIDPSLIRGDDEENLGRKVTHACYTKPVYKDKVCTLCRDVTFTPTNGAQDHCPTCKATIPERVRKRGRPAVLAWRREQAAVVVDFGAVA